MAEKAAMKLNDFAKISNEKEIAVMGFFSEIASEARRNTAYNQAPPPATQAVAAQPPTIPKPEPAPPVATETPPAQPIPRRIPIPHEVVEPINVHVPPEPEVPAPAPAAAESKQEPAAVTAPSEQSIEPPSIDLSADADAADEAQRKRDHEAAEAKRKAEWEAKQAEKKKARQEQLDRIKAMSDADLLAASVERVAADTERLTRRNMREAVAEHIQAKCREDAAFARLVMNPDKTMINCFKYINRKAREYAEQEMKDLGIERTGTYGLDVPDGLCYSWSETYYRTEVKEDSQDEEKFVPKPYIPSARKASKAKTPAKKKPEKKPAADKPKTSEKPKAPELEQMSLI